MRSYFFDGYVSPEQTNYGLYNAVHNRFVMVSTEYEILKRCVILLSSRAQLYVIKLNSATNYSHTIVDNHCCSNWGVQFDHSPDWFTHAVTVDNILVDSPFELTVNSATVPLIWQELQCYAFLAHDVVQYWQTNLNWVYRDYYDFVPWPQPLQPQKNLERLMYHTIYQSQDYVSGEAEIQRLMQQVGLDYRNSVPWPQM